MKDMRAVRANEKIKRISTLLGNGGVALLITGVSRSFVGGLDLWAGAWILLSGGIILASVQFNELLVSEDEI